MEKPPEEPKPSNEIVPVDQGIAAVEAYSVSETTGNTEADKTKIDEVNKSLAEKSVIVPVAEIVPLEKTEKNNAKKDGDKKHRSTLATIGIHGAKLFFSSLLLPLSFALKGPSKFIDWSFKVAKLPTNGSSGGGGAKPAPKKPSGGGGGGGH